MSSTFGFIKNLFSNPKKFDKKKKVPDKTLAEERKEEQKMSAT